MNEHQTERPEWQYDELKINSVMDYTAAVQALQYEERHGAVRNIAAENQNLLERLETLLPGGLANAKILEIGTGTGAFVRAAASRCAKITALDAAQAMLDAAKEKAAPLNLKNVTWIQAGFLSYKFPEQEYDAVVTSLALHHIPDVWKGEGLANIYKTLKPGGILLLVDVMFPCEGGEMAQYAPKLLASDLEERMRKALTEHLAKEYSTFDWIMDGLVEHAGLKILTHEPFSRVAEIIVAQKE